LLKELEFSASQGDVLEIPTRGGAYFLIIKRDVASFSESKLNNSITIAGGSQTCPYFS